MSKPHCGDLEAGAAADAAAGDAAKDPAAAAAAKPKKVAEEDPRLRWAFVRKVYAILALQFAATAGISFAACLVPAVPRFFTSGHPAAAVWTVYIAILVAPLIVMFPMLKYRERHPVNLVLLGLFTVCCSLSIAVATSTTVGSVVLQASILTAAAVVGLTLFTFWAVKRGYDFTFMYPFLFTSLLVLLVYLIIQIFFPLGKVGVTIYGCLATVLFCGFIIYDTNLLLKRHTYNEYVIAAISLYLDVINLFMAQLSLSAQ
ncbi:hypothetical protein ACP70R_007491 [Stipagrostis hirtigluma subsp. patula]